MKIWFVVEIDTHSEDGTWVRNYAGITPYYSKSAAQKAASKLEDDFTSVVIEEITIDADKT
jgi:hypothetical protein